MENLIFGAVMLVAAISPPVQAADIGVSLSIGQPGFYGRLDIGDYPPPQLLYRQPRIIERGDMRRAPVYLRVPPGHARNWRRHCRAYNACEEPVYFVQDNWYQHEYVPRYQETHRDQEKYDKHERHDRNKHQRHEN